MYQEKDEITPKKEKEPIKDLTTLYMENLKDMSDSTTEESHYRHILQSINIGRVLLPEEYKDLKKKAGELIKDRNIYPSRRQMELTEQRYYRLGGKNTGSIIVRPEELERGSIEAINQQCSELTPMLKEIDNEIFEILVKAGKIRAKSYEDMMEEQCLASIGVK